MGSWPDGPEAPSERTCIESCLAAATAGVESTELNPFGTVKGPALRSTLEPAKDELEAALLDAPDEAPPTSAESAAGADVSLVTGRSGEAEGEAPPGVGDAPPAEPGSPRLAPADGGLLSEVSTTPVIDC